MRTSTGLHIDAPPDTWRGLTIAPEERCSDYDSNDYRYSQSLEAQIVESLGGVYGPYTGTWFDSTSETDIEHMVARSETHDSGLCAADADTQTGICGGPAESHAGIPKQSTVTRRSR